ncbi:ribose transport system substrate-binding protein [Thermocatellispora tengchongensis]|uniref:Ribose transport system substrate-binding protein n=1 Tax=Thermocatellispora tengchongensis TaxID=1073253 RepID=A0A840P2A1_9ACTN|nr:sugar ABC transporter substrate-binding protein [Thermocatellispora tengchongensis]MBB5131590.1 ribose transport system substrate-binding protein [Thermocatellispora tengchongensis]
MSGTPLLLRRGVAAAAAAALGLALAACNSDVSQVNSGASEAPSGKTGPVKIALLASSSQNGFNKAVYDGAVAKAKELGDVEVTIFDGKFDSQTQFNQVQNVASQGTYDGIVLVPNDNVGIAAAIPAAAQAKIPVVTTLFPVGPKLTELTPQVDGVVSTVAADTEENSKKLAEGVVEYCRDKDPCKVAILIGQLQFPFDNLRNKAYRSVLDPHKNIKVVATGQGNYDRDTSLKAMQNILQANPDLDVVLSNADQQTIGAQVALESAGMDLSKMYVTGGGGSQEAVKQVRAGKWAADQIDFPNSMGKAALEQVVNAVRGKPVTPVVDADTLGPVPVIVTKEVLDQHPGFKGEWAD